MARPRSPEARIVDSGQVLIVLSPDGAAPVEKFAGTVVTEPSAGLPELTGKSVYLIGDAAKAAALDLSAAARVFMVRQSGQGDAPWPVVGPGRLPVDVHGLGVYYRRFFESDDDYVARILGEHTFQTLTESTKPGTAHRTGIYLTAVRRDREALHFRLLRCSTNLSGPTENFKATDRHIVDALNQEAAAIFAGAAPLNHVLAQLYVNRPAEAEKKQTKARISAHADKTKDMPDDGVMAFCSFYRDLGRLTAMAGDSFDRGHRGVSGLTRLRFRRKEVEGGEGGALPEQFTITLYPNSVFFMPLSTNRLYTHEVVPANLDAARMPTRLGYVVRCSNAEAVHEHGRTFLVEADGARAELEAPTQEGMAELRRLYAEENRTTTRVEYGDGLRFSMNAGDYQAPGHAAADAFRVYAVPGGEGLFAALSGSARLEQLGKGRQGAVLVAPDVRGVPVVRTTTAYTLAAQCFRAVHTELARGIGACASLAVPFNNALLEVYGRAYATMGAHSDQALDLDEAGEIAVFSCYERPDAGASRSLMIEAKEGGDAFVIPLVHGSTVVFSAETNRRFRHRIVLDPASKGPDDVWLGVTFRTSKTFVHIRDGQATLADGTLLKIADDEQRRELLRLRGQENRERDFRYPRVAYTLSESDLWPAETG